MTDEVHELTIWQESPQGMVAGQVTILSSVVSELSQSSRDGERSPFLIAERADIELAARELLRVLARIPNMQSEAA